MPPKERLTQEMIISAAYELLRTEGYEAINARALAARLGCSTMPLFRQFDSMEEIRREAICRGIAEYNRYIEDGMKDAIPFKGTGRAYLRFAREEPRLFQLFFMTPKEQIKEIPDQDFMYGAVSRYAQSAVGATTAAASRVQRDMWVFVHGIAAMIVNGTNQWTDEEIGQMLSEVFAALREREQRKGEEE